MGEPPFGRKWLGRFFVFVSILFRQTRMKGEGARGNHTLSKHSAELRAGGTAGVEWGSEGAGRLSYEQRRGAMKILGFTMGLVLVATVAWAECQTVTIDGEEKLLCDKEESSHWDDYTKQDDWIPDPIDRRQRAPFPQRSYQSGAGEVTQYSDGTTCVSKDIAGSGIIQTNCY